MRYVLARLVRRPLYFGAAVVTLTIGIGFTASMFSFANALLLRPIPVKQPQEVVSIERIRNAGTSAREITPVVSYPLYEDLSAQSVSFSSMAAARIMPMYLTRAETSTRLWGYLVSGTYFPLTGIQPWRGRFLGPEDDRPGAAPTVVLSHAAWLGKFGGDESVIGRTVSINNHSFGVAGVAPPGFNGTERFYMADCWVPFSTVRIIEGRDFRQDRTANNVWIAARLKPGANRDNADAELRVLSAAFAAEHPAEHGAMTLATAAPGLLGSRLLAPARGISVGLLLVAGLLLLVACTNVAGLVLTEASDREKEFSIRQSLGATRMHIVRLLLGETGMITALSCLLSALVAMFILDAMASAVPSELPFLHEIALDWRVALFTVAVATISAVAVGLWPALRTFRPATRFERFSVRDIYACVQVAVAVVLLAASGTMLRSLSTALQVNLGIEPERAIVLRYDLAVQGHGPERATPVAREVLARVRQERAFTSVGIANSVPFYLDQSGAGVSVQGRPPETLSRLPQAVVYQATSGYFASAGTPIEEGRDFDDTHDTADAQRVAVVNRYFVDKLLGGNQPLGKRFRFGTNGPWYEIVGVVRGGKYQTLSEDGTPAVWQSLLQCPNREQMVVARYAGVGEGEALRALRRAVMEVNPGAIVVDHRPMRDFLELPLAPLRVISGVLTAMAAVALLLAGLGVYAVLGQAVARRTREMGIRVALGATGAAVVRALAARFSILVGISTAVGAVLSFFVMRLLGRLFYADTASIPILMTTCAVVLVAALGMSGPIRRALRLDPSSAIRYE